MNSITIICNNKKIKTTYETIIKIPFLFQLTEDREYDDYKEIELFKIDVNNFNLILEFTKIDNKEIRDYINDIEQVSYYKSSIMPLSLINYLKPFDITNNKDYDKLIIDKLIRFKEDCNYLQYDLLGDIIEYKWADNYRLMDKTNLKEILTENVANIINSFNDENKIKIKNLEDKIIKIILDFYEIEEEDNDNFTDNYFLTKIGITEITSKELERILLMNINTIMDELNYIT